MKKRVLAALLCTLLMTASCGKPVDTTTETDASTETITETPAATEPEVPFPEEADYGGKTYTVIACDEGVLYTYFEMPEEETGDAMNDAIYDRNRQTEEHLNVKLGIETGALRDVTDMVTNSVAAGDDSYQLANIHIVEGGATLVTGGSLLNLYTMDTLHFENPWWNSSFVDSLTIRAGGEEKLYLASGDMIVPNARVIVMNKEMFTSLHPDTAIYDEIREGKWTLDRMAELTEGVLNDMDGNGVMDASDWYPFGDLDNLGVGTSFLHGSGLSLIQVQDNGSLSYVFDNEKLLSMMEKLHESLYREYADTKTVNISTAEFGEGHVLFGSQVLLKLQVLRDYDTDFGILPFPKYDENQEQYYSSVWNGLLGVPVTISEAAFCGHVMEVLNAASVDTISPAYYDTLLNSKFSRDEDSADMLDLIFDGVIYDIGFCFDNWIGLYSFAGNMMLKGDLNLASWAASNRNTFTAHYEPILCE